MRVLWSAVTFLAILPSALAATNQTELAAATEILAAMPECGRTCLVNEIANSSCALTDIECSCNSQIITDRTTACVTANCTVKNQLTTKNSTSTLCQHPKRDKRGSILGAAIAGLLISCFVYILRIASKIHKSPGGTGFTTTLWWDDAVLGFALLEIIAMTVSAFELNRYGFTTDLWTITFPHITWILKIYYWYQILDITALSLVKVSLLITYLRIFPQRNFRTGCYINIGLNIAYGVTFALVSVFQCWPIPMAWERWHGEFDGRCIAINAQGVASTALNLVLDVLILSLPLRSLWKMQLNNRKKFWVMLMFGLGLFVVIVAVLRLQVLIEYGDSQNFTWDYTWIGVWSTVEVHALLVCASMPALRRLLIRFAPELMGGSDAQAPASSGISGSTNESGMEKSGAADVTTRKCGRVEENYIPLDEIMTNQSQPLPLDEKK